MLRRSGGRFLIVMGLSVTTALCLVFIRGRGKWRMFSDAGDVLGFCMFFGEDTTMFSDGYSEKRFMKVTNGMSQAEVVALIGEPLTRLQEPRREIWWYTRGKVDRNYFLRAVIYGPDLRVSEIYRSFFVD